jgi:hypothetical protein
MMLSRRRFHWVLFWTVIAALAGGVAAVTMRTGFREPPAGPGRPPFRGP